MYIGSLTKLVLPQMNLPNNNYEFSIDVYRSNRTYVDNPYELEGIRVYVSTDGQIEKATELAFIPRHYTVGNNIIPAEDYEGWYTYELPIGISGTCWIILRGESQYCFATFMDNFAVKEIPSCHTPRRLIVPNVSGHSADLVWVSSYASDAWQICLNEDEGHIIDVNGNSFTLTGLAEETEYTVKVRAKCSSIDFSEWSNIVTFTTPEACPAPTNLKVDYVTGRTAALSWDGASDSYIVKYRSSEFSDGLYDHFNSQTFSNHWTKYNGLLNDVMYGTATLTEGGNWVISDNALGANNAKLNIYGTGVHSWLVSSELTVNQPSLTFDIALTDFGNSNPIEDYHAQADDRFVVLIYADDAWHILREWNNSGSQYVYNTILYTGEHVSIDLSAYDGKNVKIAFYGESTAVGGDNDMHIDNVCCGTVYPAGEWQSLNTNNNEYILTGLTPEKEYDVFVESVCPNEIGHATNVVGLTTDLACAAPINIVFNSITKNSVELGWTSDADSWEIKCFDYNDQVTTIQNVDSNPYTVTGLSPETDYTIQVRASCGGDDYSGWSNYKYFTTLEGCHIPSDVTASNVTYNSATVNWTGYSDSYVLTWSLRNIQNISTYDFEDNAIPGDMETSSDYPWEVVDNLDNGSYCMKSSNEGIASSISVITISQTYPVDGYIEFDAECRGESGSTEWDRCIFFIDADEVFKVGSALGWQHYSFPVTEGEHYFTWMYIKDSSVNPEGDYFAVDNIYMKLEYLTSQDDVNTTDATYTLNGLLPDNSYKVKVRGTCGDDMTEYSDAYILNTLPAGVAVVGYGDDPNSEGGWAFIATPVIAGNAPDEVADLIADPVQNYDLYRLNPSTSRWENYKNTDEHPDFTTMVNGQGYLYANKNDVTLHFTGTLNTDDFMEINLERGWNLVGNPFAAPAYIDRLYYKMNDEGSDIEAVENYQETAIPMCTAVLVRATAPDQKVVFTRNFESSTGNNGGLQLTLLQTVTTRGGTTLQTADKAIVSFNEDAQLTKYIFNDRTAKLYFTQDGEDYAITYSDGVGEMPLNFKARENGEYTLTVTISDNVIASAAKQSIYVHLIDNLTGSDIDLLATPSYTFSARNDDYASRFKLVFSNENEDKNDNENEDFAFISNGEIIITGEGIVQVIDVLGHQLVSRQVTSDFRLPTSDFSAGVYVLRLINGQNVKTQKIVIR